MTGIVARQAVCNNCTLKLATIAYRRKPWFRVLREPLKLGMRALAIVHRVDVNRYPVRTEACRGCIRFYKAALKERSATFRWLHRWINPLFDRAIEGIVTADEREACRRYAAAASAGEADEDADAWMRGMKTGF